MSSIKLRFEDFVLTHDAFDHASRLHGIHHTYRVMFNVLLLGDELNYEQETKLAFLAAYIHDMARKHDGFCSKHGAVAVREKLPLYIEMFENCGVDKDGMKQIAESVANHCTHVEHDPGNPYYIVTALLKDADAMDRLRLGHAQLDTRYLRFQVTHIYLGLAARLIEGTNRLPDINFTQVVEIGEGLLGRKLKWKPE